MSSTKEGSYIDRLGVELVSHPGDIQIGRNWDVDIREGSSFEKINDF